MAKEKNTSLTKVKKKKGFRSSVVMYNCMMLPGIILLLLFSTIPLFGIIIAFENYKPGMGMIKSPWVGLYWFKYIFVIPNGKQLLWNTFKIAVMKIIANIVVPVIFALLLNELRNIRYKKIVQTLVYIPHFLSWVILASIIRDMLGLDGIINQVVGLLGVEPVQFLSKAGLFQPIIVATDIWKEFGFGTIIYLAAITSVDLTLYEAAAIDGAGRWKQMLNVTLPAIRPTIVLMLTLSLGNILNAGFDQIFNLYNPLVYETGDIIDTYVYRVGLVDRQYSLGTAIGLFKSMISLVLMAISQWMAGKFANYRIF